MNDKHKAMVNQVKALLTSIVNDFSVMPEEALESLQELRQDIDEAMQRLTEDIADDEVLDIYMK